MSLTKTITKKLEKAFAPTHLELENESHRHASGAAAETHFKLVMVSGAFEGLSRVERQRRVMELLAPERAQGLHALTLRVMTPAEWDVLKESFEMISPACHGGSKAEKRN